MHASQSVQVGGARAIGGRPARLILSGLAVIVLLSGPALSVGPTESSWPQFRGDDLRLGIAASPIPSTNETLWSVDLPEQVQSSFAVAQGRALVGCDDGNLYCFDANNGSLLWNFTTENAVQSSPTVPGDLVYFGALDGHLYCLRLADGSVSWGFTCGMVVSSPALAGGLVYFGDQSGRFWALNASTGAEAWNRSYDSGIWGSPTVAGGRVYFGDITGGFHCLDATNGTSVWQAQWDGSDVYSSACVQGGRVLISRGLGDVLMCLDAATGDEVWHFSPANHVYASVAVRAGVVYCHSWKYLWAIPWDDPDSSGEITPGEALWSFFTNDTQGGSSPTVSGDRVVVGSDAGRVFCLYTGNGTLAWEAPMPGFVYSSPAVALGRVYIGSTSGKVSCLGSPTTPRVYTKLTPAKTTVSGGQSVTIDITVTDATGAPSGDAFMAYSATGGKLSATFGTVVQGAFRISWTAPAVSSTTIVRISATGSLQGYEVMGDEAAITVTPAAKVVPPKPPRVAHPAVLVGLVAFVAIDSALAIVLIRRRKEMGVGRP
jgi:outer membrane protein assembly factor BamB